MARKKGQGREKKRLWEGRQGTRRLEAGQRMARWSWASGVLQPGHKEDNVTANSGGTGRGQGFAGGLERKLSASIRGDARHASKGHEQGRPAGGRQFTMWWVCGDGLGPWESETQRRSLTGREASKRGGREKQGQGHKEGRREEGEPPGRAAGRVRCH